MAYTQKYSLYSAFFSPLLSLHPLQIFFTSSLLSLPLPFIFTPIMSLFLFSPLSLFLSSLSSPPSVWRTGGGRLGTDHEQAVARSGRAVAGSGAALTPSLLGTTANEEEEEEAA